MDDEQENTEDAELYGNNDEALNTAASVVDALMSLVSEGYGMLSLIKPDEDALARKNFGFIKTGSMSFEHNTGENSFVSLSEFEGLLAGELMSAKSDASLVFAVFENYSPDNNSLNIPTCVYQWVFAKNTILPDHLVDNTWNGVAIEPGLEFVEGAYDDYDHDDREEEFTLPDTSVVAPFLSSLVRKAPDGNHIISVVLSDIEAGFNVSSLTFSKSGDTVVIDESRGGLLIIDVAATVNAGEHAGITLRSYTSRVVEDGFEPREDVVEEQEVRGWHLSLAGVHGFSVEECLEVYCIDENTGEPTTPEPYIQYCAAWSLDED